MKRRYEDREREPLVIVAGVRTPFAKAGGAFASLHAEDLGTLALRELICQTGLPLDRLDGVIAGNVGQQSRAANIARIIALRAGVPDHVPAFTVHRNCASGFEAITQCADLLAAGRGELFVAIGTESMSNYPLVFNERGTAFFTRMSRARSPLMKLKTLASFRPSMVAPKIALMEGLTDPVVGLGMGQTAELLAREWGFDRDQQDTFARESHRKALEGRERLRAETMDVVTERGVLRDDDGVRDEAGLSKLGKLPTVFARQHGSVTAGNASQITDGAAALLVASRRVADTLGVSPLGILERHAYAGCDPRRMGLGPVYAMDHLYPETPLPLDSLDLFEINEAFAAQVLACLAAAEDPTFCREQLQREVPLGAIPRDRLNVNGGAIAMGHPVGTSGARLVLTALHELARRDQRRALVSLCVGGGQGAALVLARP